MDDIDTSKLQFLDSRVNYLDSLLTEIIETYGENSVDIITNVDIAVIDALSDSTGGQRTHFIDFLDSDGQYNKGINSKDSQGTIIPQTIFQDNDKDRARLKTTKGDLQRFQDTKLRDKLEKRIRGFALEGGSPASQTTNKEMIKQIRGYMRVLGEVFGFNTPEDKEMFMAGWLAKDTTTRLSGIPGTGKTTLIECAALLFGNSYGFIKDEKNPANQVWSSKRSEDEVNRWEDTRFKENSYRYPFSFLLNHNILLGLETLDTINSKSKEMFSLSQGIGGALNNTHFHVAVEALKLDYLLLSDEKGNPEIVSGSTVGESEGYSIKDGWFKWPIAGDYNFYKVVSIKSILDKWNSMSSQGEGLESTKLYDANAESLQDLIKILEDFSSKSKQSLESRDFAGMLYYDVRIDSERGRIDSEMRKEVGLAKVDKDKRAEQLLYGVDITSEDVKGGLDYKFKPFPRPIVTQPIKFFNEVNRSQASVEDAILGLIAEGEVEYRGEVFKSPPYIAFMDTNPHVGGNDLAFTDRIDMELLFPSALLDQRYKLLMGRLDKDNRSESPRARILDKIILGEVVPMRFEGGLQRIWDDAKNVSYVKDGYNALMDISIISTLFSQRFGVHDPSAQITLDFQTIGTTKENTPTGTNLMEHDRNSGLYKQSLIPVNSSGYFIDASISESRTYRTDLKKSNQAIARGHGAMALMDRVLAMRFTNSLAKLSRSLAYLRGNQYVTRKEVMDCLPYVVGHRMGRSKGEGGKMEYGLKSAAAAQFASGQEFVREAIVKGYIDRALNSFGSLTAGLTEGSEEAYTQSRWVEWDSMLSQARKDLINSRTYAEYEMKMWAIGRMSSGDGKPSNATGTGDPMPYLIYRLVLMEELTTGDESKFKTDLITVVSSESNSSVTTAIPKSYSARIETYQDWITNLLTSKQNYTANDIGILRRRVTLERWLTTDDKYSLLNQLDSLIDDLTGFQIPDNFGDLNTNTGVKSKMWGLYSACPQQLSDEYKEIGLTDTTHLIGFPENDFIRNPTWYGGSRTGRASKLLYAGQDELLTVDAFIGTKKPLEGGEGGVNEDGVNDMGVLMSPVANVSYPTAAKKNSEQTISFDTSIRTKTQLENAITTLDGFLNELDVEFVTDTWVEMLPIEEVRTENAFNTFSEQLTRDIQSVYDKDDGALEKDYIIQLDNENGNFTFAESSRIILKDAWDDAATAIINDNNSNKLRLYVSVIGDSLTKYLQVNICLASMNVRLDVNGNLTPVLITDENPFGFDKKGAIKTISDTVSGRQTFFDLGNITKENSRKFREVANSSLKSA